MKTPSSPPSTGYKSSLREFFRQTLPPASPPRMRTMPKPAAKPAPVIPTKLGLIVDLFAGGGGASRGVEAAMGRTIDLAINHDKVALAAHAKNHPHTKHLVTDIWEVEPKEAVGTSKVDLLWASPDCTHFSVAKGGKPRKQRIRSLAWIVVKWAKQVRPSTIFLENVSEFQTWGPLTKEGKPDKARMGETFSRWRRMLERLGYSVDYRVLDASKYGAPTKRRRLFLVARCDGQPIVWPSETHGPGKLPYHTAAECIDWSIQPKSIFDLCSCSKTAVIRRSAKGGAGYCTKCGKRRGALAEKTLWRIAQGIKKFVLENPEPFIVGVGGRMGQSEATGSTQPLGTITAKNDRAVVTPHLVQVNHGGREDRSESLEEPLTTVTAARRGHALVTPVLSTIDQRGAEARGQEPNARVDQPLSTVVTKNRHALVAPTLVQTGYGERPGQRPRFLDLQEPLGTVVADGQKHALVSAFLNNHQNNNTRKGGGGKVIGQKVNEPITTIKARDSHSLTAAALVKMNGDPKSHGQTTSLDEPLPTIAAQGGHLAQVRAFLTVYYGGDETGGQKVDAPMKVITAKSRLGLVTVHGVDYQIVDIGLRMLEPEELLRAQFGKYAAGYDLSEAKTKEKKIRLIGNSVCPEMAEVLVKANVSPELTRKAA